ncbi:MAG: hypothetical protein ABI633_12925 [Burkholderiales bacterium]
MFSGNGAEMKIDLGPGYRVYFTRCGAELVLHTLGLRLHVQPTQA